MVFNSTKIIKINDALFKKRLNDILKEKKITQKELASLLDVTPLTVFRWLHQPLQSIKRESLIMLSRVLDVPVNYFLDENFKLMTIEEMYERDVKQFNNDNRAFLDYLESMGTYIEYAGGGSCYVHSKDFDGGNTSIEHVQRLKRKLELYVIDYFL